MIIVYNVEYFSVTALCGLQEERNKNLISESAELFVTPT
jgi:hypothetical protein